MLWILKLKHWQVFILLIVVLIASNTNITYDPTMTLVLNLSAMGIYFLFPLLLGHSLYQVAPDRIRLNYNFFMFNSFVWLISYVVIMILSDGQGMSFSGVAALPGFYVVYAFLYYLSFPMKALKSIEKGKSVPLGEYIGEFFLFLFLPIGIWFLMPRINKIGNLTENEGD